MSDEPAISRRKADRLDVAVSERANVDGFVAHVGGNPDAIVPGER